MDWVAFKNYLSQITDLHQDALHIYAALGVQLAAAVILRRSLATVWPWLAVAVVLLANEYWDVASTGDPIEQWQVIGGAKDIWNTMVLPTVLLVFARFAPAVLVRRERRLRAASPAADVAEPAYSE